MAGRVGGVLGRSSADEMHGEVPPLPEFSRSCAAAVPLALTPPGRRRAAEWPRRAAASLRRRQPPACFALPTAVEARTEAQKPAHCGGPAARRNEPVASTRTPLQNCNRVAQLS